MHICIIITNKIEKIKTNMKRIAILTLSLLFVFAAAAFSQAAKPAEKAKTASFQWKETTHDFAKITQGKPVTAEFKFKNTGSVPLVISSAQGSCGCTVPEYSKEPIAPGKEGIVKATFNAANAGAFTKTVTITANTEKGQEVLTIKGEVIAQATPAQ